MAFHGYTYIRVGVRRSWLPITFENLFFPMISQIPQNCVFRWAGVVAAALVSGITLGLAATPGGDEPKPVSVAVPVAVVDLDESAFQERVQPLLEKYCTRCHNEDVTKSGVRVDQLTPNPTDRQLFLWQAIQKQVDDGAMPPHEEPQFTAAEKTSLNTWITAAIAAGRARDTKKNGSVRRLTVSQYRNTLKRLLGLEEDLTDPLPPDGTSKEGFSNQSQSMVLSPLQIEAYFDIAEKAIGLSLVEEDALPVIQNFRMDLGTAINPHPCPDNLVLGANNFLLSNPDVLVTELQPEKPFAYKSFSMRTEYEFIEGYVGNDTIRAWKKFNSIYHSVFACMRGTPGYPKGQAFQVVPQGLLLRPAVPSPEIFGQSDTYGPMANFKISLRELPDQGNFRVTVRAARYDDALLLEPGLPLAEPGPEVVVTAAQFVASPDVTVTVTEAGIYQLDVYRLPAVAAGPFSVTMDDRQFAGALPEIKPIAAGDAGKPDTPLVGHDAAATAQGSALLLLRLSAGEHKLTARLGDPARFHRLVLTRRDDESEAAKRFRLFEQRTPSIGVYVGLRRDCGSTLTPVGPPRPIEPGGLQEYVFSGAINDFPSPDVEKENVNYLAGIREIGVRSEYTDGRDMPRLLVRSVEFEGPYYETWPPASHQQIFPASAAGQDPAVQARASLRSFMTRASRRPVTAEEEEGVFAVWKNSFSSNGNRRQSMADAMLVVLTSPQFLFLIENSPSPEPEDLDPFELASKLSYFLWNGPPDARLLELAAANTLHASLDEEIDRMIRDPQFARFVSEFTSQWLSLDKFDVVAIDAKRYPRLTRDTKAQLRQEPVQFVQYLIQQNLPLRNLVKSDFIVANEVVASYYNLASGTESGFRFVAIPHAQENLGGVLTQAGILAGLSDGRESNPIKRGAWVARKIVAEPPDDPPPNVPQLPQDDGSQLTLREKLERHRDQPGCAKCHAGIDPWGLPFEAFDASGQLKAAGITATGSTLPDGAQVNDMNGLKAYLATERIDQVAFSFMKHLACYAIGRSLTYNEFQSLREQGKTLRSNDYRMHDMIRFVIKSDMFLKK